MKNPTAPKIPTIPTIGPYGRWGPSRLFSGGAQGMFLDPSVLSSLSRDNLGATPVTGPGQSVGRVLDRSGRDNHATQATAAAKPTLGRHPKGGRRNLLTRTEDFENPVWAKVNRASMSGNILTGTSLASYIQQKVSFAAPLPVSAYVESATATACRLGGEGLNWSLNFNLVTGEVVAGHSTWTDHSIVPHGSGYIVSATPPYGSLAIRISPGAADMLVHWAQLGVLPYQRVTNQYDVTEAGVPDVWHLFFDGVDDALGVTLPAGTYGRAWVSELGVVTVDSVTDPTSLTFGAATRVAGFMLRQGAFSSAEIAALTNYWEGLYK